MAGSADLSPSPSQETFRLKFAVFFLVSAGFTTIYLVQPVLPVLQQEFGVDETRASLAVSAVVLGIALSSLPFGRLADLYPVKPIIAAGGSAVALFGLVCALTRHMELLVACRFLQGLFLPALTTCTAAYLSRSLPAHRLNVMMGSYVAATVVGGLSGRLIGGWIHPPLHWRYAFLTVSVLVAAAAVIALKVLPPERGARPESPQAGGFLELIKRTDLLRIYSAGFSAFFVFSALFNYLPFHLSGEGFRASTNLITCMYLTYILGVFIAPLSGRISNRFGNGVTMTLGALLLGASLAVTHIPHVWAVVLGLCGVCLGFFSVHSAAVGGMNRRLEASRGRANSLYIMLYYLGGSAGITLCGHGYQRYGWLGVTGLGMLAVLNILGISLVEIARDRRKGVAGVSDGSGTNSLFKRAQ
jgi:YNFM family putative membrane transporter